MIHAENEWMILAENEEFEKAIMSYVHSHTGTSFSELYRHFKKYMQTEGPYALRVAENNYVWVGMSEFFAGVLYDMIRNRALYVQMADPEVYGERLFGILSYFVDGGGLPFPLARRVQAYRRPHWMMGFLNVRKPSHARILNDKIELHIAEDFDPTTAIEYQYPDIERLINEYSGKEDVVLDFKLPHKAKGHRTRLMGKYGPYGEVLEVTRYGTVARFHSKSIVRYFEPMFKSHELLW